MNVLITGAQGFIGKNLVASLEAIRNGGDKTTELSSSLNIIEYDLDTEAGLLDGCCEAVDFVFHLAGVNRPQNMGEFMEGNLGFTTILLDTLGRHQNACPIMFASSTQANLDNPYGQSKKAVEELLFSHARQTGARILVYRFPNVFGKWCRPHYNSAVATFCHNIARGLPIQISDRSHPMTLVYIDDVVSELIRALCGNASRDAKYCHVPVEHQATLGEIANQLYSFKASRGDRNVPDLGDPFTKKLYATYLSYLPADNFSYPLQMHTDDRGSFTEMLRTPDRGQFSVNISKPGVTKGNHWHHTKSEKFLVVSGEGVVRFRRIDKEEVMEYHVSGDTFEVVDIPPGYTHHIENLGSADLVTLMWSSECFDPEYPDTFYSALFK